MKEEISDRKATSGCFPSLSHASTYEHLYHTNPTAKDTDPCPQPTGNQEGDAVVAAWQKYNAFSETYCAAGNGSCTNPKTCKPSVSGHTSRTGPVRRQFTPTPGTAPPTGKLECYLTIETSAKIACACS
ncbi:MAG: hypothetical protein AAF767_06655 [Pseudomonadota bacterium]